MNKTPELKVLSLETEHQHSHVVAEDSAVLLREELEHEQYIGWDRLSSAVVSNAS